MPFGLTNAPATYQRELDIVITKFMWKTCFVYMDDAMICSNSVEEHINHVDEIMTTLAEAAVTIYMKKCTF